MFASVSYACASLGSMFGLFSAHPENREEPPPHNPDDALLEQLKGRCNGLAACLNDIWPNALEACPNIEAIKYIAEEIMSAHGPLEERFQNCHDQAKDFLDTYNTCRDSLTRRIQEGGVTEERLNQLEREGNYSPEQLAILTEQLKEENRAKGGIVGAYATLEYEAKKLKNAGFLLSSEQSNELSKKYAQLSTEFCQLMEATIAPSNASQGEDTKLTAPIFPQFTPYVLEQRSAWREIVSIDEQIKTTERARETLTQRIKAVDPARIGESSSIIGKIYLLVRLLLHRIGLYQQPDRDQIETLIQQRKDRWGELLALQERRAEKSQIAAEPFYPTSMPRPAATTKAQRIINCLEQHIDCFKDPLVQNFMSHFLTQAGNGYRLTIDGNKISIRMDGSIEKGPLSPDTCFPKIPQSPAPLDEGSTAPNSPISTASVSGSAAITARDEGSTASDSESVTTEQPNEGLGADVSHDATEDFVIVDNPIAPSQTSNNTPQLYPLNAFPLCLPLSKLSAYRSILGPLMEQLKNNPRLFLPENIEMTVEENKINFEGKNPPSMQAGWGLASFYISSISFKKLEGCAARRELAEVTVQGTACTRTYEDTFTLTDMGIVFAHLCSMEPMDIAE